MIKLAFLVFAVSAAVGTLMFITANRAKANPGQSSQCAVCHPADMPATSVSVVVAGETETAISYDVTGSTSYDAREGWAVFSPGGVNVANGYGPGLFTLPRDGGTYRVYWVDDADSCNTAVVPPSCSKGGSAYEDVIPSSSSPTPAPTSDVGAATPTPLPDTPTPMPEPDTPAPTSTVAPETPTPEYATPTPQPSATLPASESETPTPPPVGSGVPARKSAVYGTAHDLGSPAIPTCEQCHTSHNAQGNYLWARAPRTDMAGLQSLCFSCHDGSITPIGAFIADPAYESHEVEPGVGGADCDRCHDPHADTWAFTDPAALPGAFQNADLCLGCHGVGAISHWMGQTNAPVDRTWDPYASTGPDFSGTRLWNEAGTEAVPTGEAYMKCLTCHTVHGVAGGGLTSMTYDQLCLNCHD